MKYSGKYVMSLAMMGISAGVVLTALKWPFKAALFPVIVGVFGFFMATTEFLLSLFEKEGKAKAKEAAVDFGLSEDIEKRLAIQRTIAIFSWIVGFFLAIILFGFPIAVPLFVFLYLKLRGDEGWGLSILITGLTWGFFYGLFIWLLNTPFQDGWILREVKILLGM